MKVEQLDKTLDAIMNNLDEDLFFVWATESINEKTGRRYKTLHSTELMQLSIENIKDYIEGDKYVLIKVS